MAHLLLFGPAREAARTHQAEVAAGDVDVLLDEAVRRFGPQFAAVLRTAQVWVNGEPAAAGSPVGDADEVAVLPPVSGG
jgi:molybdopterin synthase sulfur carrier subunit